MSYPIPLTRGRRLDLRVHADADTRLRAPRRAFQITLGVLWLLDAALQFQPYMFTPAFVHHIIAPTAQGNPGWISSSETWAASLMVAHVTVYDAVFGTVQLLLAIAILFRPTVKIGLAASIPWAIGVWWFGEGLGGVFTGASPLTAAPGAVILYALIAVLVWPRASERDGVSVAAGGPLGRHLPRVAWLLLWGSATYFLLLAPNRAPGSYHDVFAGMAGGEPGWLAGIDAHLAGYLAGAGGGVSIVLAACCALVAVSVFVPALTRPGLVVAVLLGLAIWLAQNFGGILTGQGTDPNSGLLLVFLALVYWPLSGAATEPGLAGGGAAPSYRERRLREPAAHQAG
ncbi:MAG: hypothetical protein ACRDGL_04200 [Candidatus Limnocylindrales bacterium]